MLANGLTYYYSLGIVSQLCIQYRFFNDYNWFFPFLLFSMAMLYEIAAINLMDVIGDFYGTLTDADKAGFIKVLYKSLVVTTIISILYSLQSYASEACALQWRERLVRMLQTVYIVDGGSKDGLKHRSDVKTGAASQADQWITQNTDRLTTQSAKFLEKSIAIPFLIIYYTYWLYDVFGWIVPAACYVYWLLGTLCTAFFSRKLVPLVYKQEALEGEFRSQHIRYNLHHESIHFLNGVATERQFAETSFNSLLRNKWKLTNLHLPMYLVVNWFSYFGSVVNYAVIGVAILYFTNEAEDHKDDDSHTSSIVAQGSYACLYLINAFSTSLEAIELLTEVMGLAGRVTELLDHCIPGIGISYSNINNNNDQNENINDKEEEEIGKFNSHNLSSIDGNEKRTRLFKPNLKLLPWYSEFNPRNLQDITAIFHKCGSDSDNCDNLVQEYHHEQRIQQQAIERECERLNVPVGFVVGAALSCPMHRALSRCLCGDCLLVDPDRTSTHRNQQYQRIIHQYNQNHSDIEKDHEMYSHYSKYDIGSKAALTTSLSENASLLDTNNRYRDINHDMNVAFTVSPLSYLHSSSQNQLIRRQCQVYEPSLALEGVLLETRKLRVLQRASIASLALISTSTSASPSPSSFHATIAIPESDPGVKCVEEEAFTSNAIPVSMSSSSSRSNSLTATADNMNTAVVYTVPVLLSDLSFRVNIGDCLLISGHSGCGKTSLLRALAGLQKEYNKNESEVNTRKNSNSFVAVDKSDKDEDSSLLDTNVLVSENENKQKNESQQNDKTSMGVVATSVNMSQMWIVPQNPYCFPGTLRANLLYPHLQLHGLCLEVDNDEDDDITDTKNQNIDIDTETENSIEATIYDPIVDKACIHALEAMRLDHLLAKNNENNNHCNNDDISSDRNKGLDVIDDWMARLSLGEQQRLEIARVLLALDLYSPHCSSSSSSSSSSLSSSSLSDGMNPLNNSTFTSKIGEVVCKTEGHVSKRHPYSRFNNFHHHHLAPTLIFLDEATSSVDEEMETIIYSTLISRVKDRAGAIVSVAHRSTVRRYHDRELRIHVDGTHSFVNINTNTSD